MFKKKLLKFLNNFFNNDYVKIVLYLLGFVIIFILWQSINGGGADWSNIIDILQGDVAISVFIVGLFSILLKHVFMMLDSALEESQKTDDDHHSIIQRYSGHSSDTVDTAKNYFNLNGNYMTIHNTDGRAVKNHVRDPYSDKYAEADKEIRLFTEQGLLRLPTVNVYTNILGNCSVVFDDSPIEGEIPSFIISNAGTIFKAHMHSRTTNNTTVRLKDLSLDGDCLTLHTERSSYYRMLLTNRCMDYELENGMTVRNLFEYKKTVSPLNESKMSNQIGINGVIITKDGYLLIEKRDRKKTTWKNKFAQPISLALKENDLCKKGSHTIGNSPEEATERLFGVIKKTVKANFGLTEEDYGTLSFEKNFLGVARDVLEGGKPNLYFVLTLNKTAKELLVKLHEAAAKTDKDALKTEKLYADYYLVPFDKMKFGYHYEMKLKLDEIYRVDRWVAPRMKKSKVAFRKAMTALHDFFFRYTEHECGEALLVCYAYLELCLDRIPVLTAAHSEPEQEISEPTECEHKEESTV